MEPKVSAFAARSGLHDGSLRSSGAPLGCTITAITSDASYTRSVGVANSPKNVLPNGTSTPSRHGTNSAGLRSKKGRGRRAHDCLGGRIRLLPAADGGADMGPTGADPYPACASHS